MVSFALQRPADLVDLTKEMPVLRGAVPEQDPHNLGRGRETGPSFSNSLNQLRASWRGIGGEDILRFLLLLVLLHEAADRPTSMSSQARPGTPRCTRIRRLCVRLEHLPC